MALDVRRLQPDDPPPLRVVAAPRAPVDDPIGDEFLYPPNNRALRVPRKPRGRRRRLLPLLLILCLGAAALLVVRSLGADDPATPPTRRAAQSAPAGTAAPPAPAANSAGVPMMIVSSRIVPGAAQTYRAAVSVRNPTDVPAADVTITVTVKDGSGRVLKTDTQMLDVLPSGRTADVEFTGELEAGAAAAALEVQATASRLISPSV